MTAADSLRSRQAPGLVAALLTLALLLIAVLAPASGLVSADTSCPYGNCPSSPTTPFFETMAGYAVIVVVVVALAAIGIGLLVRKFRGKGGSSAAGAESDSVQDDGSGGSPPSE